MFLLADGIALGAAAASSNTDVEMIVFVAIMLHKVWMNQISNYLQLGF